MGFPTWKDPLCRRLPLRKWPSKDGLSFWTSYKVGHNCSQISANYLNTSWSRSDMQQVGGNDLSACWYLSGMGMGGHLLQYWSLVYRRGDKPGYHPSLTRWPLVNPCPRRHPSNRPSDGISLARVETSDPDRSQGHMSVTPARRRKSSRAHLSAVHDGRRPLWPPVIPLWPKTGLFYRDYQRKQKTIKTLKRKALDKNPDEFYFKMVKTRLEVRDFGLVFSGRDW